MATQTMKIADIQVPARRRPLKSGTVKQLAKSIALIGLLNAITVTADGVLIAGLHRLDACRRLGWTEIPVRVLDGDLLDAELAEIDENLIRAEVTVLERGELLKRRKELYEAKHPETRHGGAPGKAGGGKVAKRESLSSFADDTAAHTGVSPRTVQQEVQIATAIPDDVQDALRETPVADNKTSLLALARMKDHPDEQLAVAQHLVAGQPLTAARRMVKRQAQEPSTAEGYRVLYAAPPETMDGYDLPELPVGALAAQDAVLFYWTESWLLAQSLHVIAAWGFTYRDAFVWDMVKKVREGMYTAMRHELLLVATKGECLPECKELLESVVACKRPGRGSGKPAQFRALIDQMYPNGRRIELFAREAAAGWDIWDGDWNDEEEGDDDDDET